MISGSCLCGAVSYRVLEKPSDIVHCHCVICRKAHGSAFASMTAVPLDSFELDGASNLNRYESSPGKWRYFCKSCGTPLYAQREGKENVGLSLGSLDTDLPCKEFARIWMSDRASWYDVDATLPQYEKSWRDK